ncbi:MAG TPA: DUF885 domain-containing protein, partial [Chthoniobacterales bacterium]
MFKRLLKWIGGIVALLLIVAAVFLVNLIWFRPWSLNAFYEKVFVEILFDEPELLSSVGLVEQFGITGHNAKLSDESPAHQRKQSAHTRRSLEQLREYPLERQTESQRLSTKVMEWYLTVQAEGERFQFHNYPVNQLFGVQSRFPSFMANTHRLLAARDCEYYLKRLAALPAKFDQVLEGLRLREQMGITPPRFVVDKVLREMREFVAKPAAENILASSFKARASRIEKLSDADRADFQARVEAAITTKVYPAYQKLIDYFADLQPRTTTDDGVWKLPDGEAFYAHVLHQNTTTTRPAAEIHALGVAEVARIEA